MRASVAFTRIVVSVIVVLAVPTSPLHAASGEPYRLHALVGARVIVAPGEILPRATIVVRDGVIEAVGENLAPPPGARVYDLAGKTVFAGFIDPYLLESKLAAKKGKKDEEGGGRRGWRPNEPPNTARLPGDSHELPWVHPEYRVADSLQPDAESLATFRELGFVAAQVVPDDGILRGSGAVISLSDGPLNRSLLDDSSAIAAALAPRDSEYPDSLMGVIAVLRQSFYDARWYREVHEQWASDPRGRQRPEHNRALEALSAAAAGKKAVLIDAGTDVLNLMRAGRVAEEMVLKLWLVASGSEYRRLNEIKELGAPLIVPINFPAAPVVGDDDEWTLVSTSDLENWKYAPANPGWLNAAGLDIALTTARLEKSKDFPEKMVAAIKAGLDPEAALAALTTTPAKLLGLDRLLGTIEAGKIASFVVANGDPFLEESAISETWVDGTRYASNAKPKPATGADPTGVFFSAVGHTSFFLDLKRADGELGGELFLIGPHPGTLVPISCAEAVDGRLRIELDGKEFGHAGTVVLTAWVERSGFAGVVDAAGAAPFTIAGERLSDAKSGHEAGKKKPTAPAPNGGPLASPTMIFIDDATIWTSGPAGRIDHGDLVAKDGVIVAVGRDLSAPADAHLIDGRGRHVTPGIVDAHSHTAISGAVNEATHAVTAEVRIGDVVDSQDWNIYFQLAGGLTAANLLHGSANPIGGQSETIKFRWGAPPEKLKLEGQKPGIKFALGENVKQSNWGDAYDKRYPQTRLGVEQVMRERFLAARDYLRTWDDYRAGNNPLALAPRRDLQLDAIVEILRGERLIHCHSYRQDEILMLIRLAEEQGIIPGTFQHVLDGYKVADEIARLGAGASTFSDWWGYKYEVIDAIPYNGALMWDRGVVVSFNSDSNDLARRLNLEAAKAVKWGGVPEEEALKFVTINPAMQLRVDHRIGSLEAGKDADFVIWNGSPLASTSHALETWIDGSEYFDYARDQELRRERQRSRQALIEEAKAAAEPKGGKR